MDESVSGSNQRTRKYVSPHMSKRSLPDRQFPIKNLLRDPKTVEIRRRGVQKTYNDGTNEESGSFNQNQSSSFTGMSSYVLLGKGILGKNQMDSFHHKDKEYDRILATDASPKSDNLQMLLPSLTGVIDGSNSLPKKKKITNSYSPAGEDQSGDANAQKGGQEANDVVVNPPMIYYTNTMGTKDRARRDLIAYINEKKARKEQAEKVESSSSETGSDDHSLLRNTKPKENKKLPFEHINEQADDDREPEIESNQGSQGDSYSPALGRSNSPSLKRPPNKDNLDDDKIRRTEINNHSTNTASKFLEKCFDVVQEEEREAPPPVIHYTNSHEDKRKAKEDIVTYVREKRNQKLNQQQQHFEPEVEQEPPIIRYTNTYNSKRKAREDILAFMEEKKARAQHSQNKSLLLGEVGGEKMPLSPQIKASKLVSPLRRNLKAYGKSNSMDRNTLKNLTVQAKSIQNLSINVTGSPNRLPPLTKNDATTDSSIHGEKIHKIFNHSPQNPERLPIISPSGRELINKSISRKQISRSRTVDRLATLNYSIQEQNEQMEADHTRTKQVNNYIKNTSESMIEKDSQPLAESSERNPVIFSSKKPSRFSRQDSYHIPPNTFKRKVMMRQNTSQLDLSNSDFYSQSSILKSLHSLHETSLHSGVPGKMGDDASRKRSITTLEKPGQEKVIVNTEDAVRKRSITTQDHPGQMQVAKNSEIAQSTNLSQDKILTSHIFKKEERGKDDLKSRMMRSFKNQLRADMNLIVSKQSQSQMISHPIITKIQTSKRMEDN